MSARPSRTRYSRGLSGSRLPTNVSGLELSVIKKRKRLSPPLLLVSKVSCRSSVVPIYSIAYLSHTVLLFVLSSHIEANNLNGHLPWELSKLIYLKTLELHHNALSGTIPSEIGLLKDCESIDLKNNLLSGTIPPEVLLVQVVNVEVYRGLMLQENLLTGTIPSAIGKSLWPRLNLDQNLLTGSLPKELFHSTAMKHLHIRNNNMVSHASHRIGL